MIRFAVLFLCFSTAVHADVTLTMEESGTDKNTASQVVFKIKDNKMLMTDSGADGRTAIMYEGDNGIITQIDHGSKSYMRMDKESTAKISGQMDAAMEQMMEQLKNMPPEQRKMLESRMPQIVGRMGNKTMPSYSVKHNGKKDKVAGVSCAYVDLYKDKVLDGTACVANADQLGIDKKDYATIESMMSTMQEFAEQFGGDDMMPDFKSVGGFPVISESGSAGKQSRLKSVDTDGLNADDFVIPESYRERSLGQ